MNIYKKIETLKEEIKPNYNNTLFTRKLKEAIDEIYGGFIKEEEKREEIYNKTIDILKKIEQKVEKLYEDGKMKYHIKEAIRIDTSNWKWGLWWWKEIIKAKDEKRVPTFEGKRNFIEVYAKEFLSTDEQRLDYYEKLLIIVEEIDNKSGESLVDDIIWIDDKRKHFVKKIKNAKRERNSTGNEQKELEKEAEKPKIEKLHKLLYEVGMDLTVDEFKDFIEHGGEFKLREVNGKKVYDYEACHFIVLLKDNLFLKVKLDECSIRRKDWKDINRNYRDYVTNRKGNKKNPRDTYQNLEEEIKNLA